MFTLIRPLKPLARIAVVILLLLVAAEVLFPLLYAYTQPRNQAIQQGRYCFPALAHGRPDSRHCLYGFVRAGRACAGWWILSNVMLLAIGL